MKYTDRFTSRFSSLARRSGTATKPARSHTPRHEALALGLGCGRGRLATRPEWR